MKPQVAAGLGALTLQFEENLVQSSACGKVRTYFNLKWIFSLETVKHMYLIQPFFMMPFNVHLNLKCGRK